jgi:hypothetical protein
MERTSFSGVVSLPRMRDMFQLRRSRVRRSRLRGLVEFKVSGFKFNVREN